MASSPSTSPLRAVRLRRAPTGVRRPHAASSSSSSFIPVAPLCGLLALSSASRVRSIPFLQRPLASLVVGRSRLSSAAASSADPGEIDAVNMEGTEQSVGGSNVDIIKCIFFTVCRLLEKLKRYGAAGVLSYGLLNTVYYVTAFLLVWFYFAPAPGKMGYAAAVERALALAPFVDRGLRWFTVKFNFKSEGRAFATIVGFCFAIAALLFFGLTILWA
ncbi:hypothetical protein EJB05_43223 [Eragrostis curvula]|uniref:Uncharacterized protein n=1 Tax=Eragrostis curvula TaxID=38414 RepID=A0A5J9TEA4_9POAL|nr:hypothetical protein EJB05_43223 [Eragrostis curvula]